MSARLKEISQKKEKQSQYKFKGTKQARERKERVVELLRESFFDVSWTIRQLRIQRRSFRRWKQKDPEFERACYETEEGVKDKAEMLLQIKMREGNTKAIIFFLKTKCKDRGYG